jgi:leucyl-tRNA synthetase
MMGTLSPATTAHATDSCVSGAEVRTQVHALVSSLTDDVRSRSTRAELAAALVETLKTYRGASADTAAERRALGQQVAELARQLQAASNRVARKAIVLQIHALGEQREQGPFTDAERTALTADLTALKQAVVAKTDGGAEGRAVAASFKSLHTQFVCSPA